MVLGAAIAARKMRPAAPVCGGLKRDGERETQREKASEKQTWRRRKTDKETDLLAKKEE